MTKFELTNETKTILGTTLHRIRALRYFGDVKAGDLGGWIEKEENLSHDGDCWVFDDARVSGNAIVSGDVWTASPIYIQGSRHPLTSSSFTTITIGCHTLTHEEWLERYEEIGREHGYSKEEIEEYGDYIKMIITQMKRRV